MKTMDKEVFAQQDAFGIGAPNVAYAQYFIGRSYLKPLTQPDASAVFLANVTFEPACRNNWHIHHASRGGGQLVQSHRRRGSRREHPERMGRAGLG